MNVSAATAGDFPDSSRSRAVVPCGGSRADGWIRTSMGRFTGPVPFYFEPHRPSRSARIRTLSSGFGDRVLSQEHTPVQGVWGESNPPPRPSQGPVPSHYTTDTIHTIAVPRGWERASFANLGRQRKARESNPHLRWENRLSRAARPTVSGYLPKWTHRESNPDLQSAELVSSRWTMSPCEWTARDLHPHLRRAKPASSSWTSSPRFRGEGLEPS